jgi:hydrocephalus-inducing protein
VLHVTHWLPERAEYKCSFKSSSSGGAAPAAAAGMAASSSGFDAPVSVVAPPAGPAGVDVECVVGFEPCALGEAVRDVLLLSSAAAGVYEVPLMGQCVPPKPQGPIDVSKVGALLRGVALTGWRHCCEAWTCYVLLSDAVTVVLQPCTP